MKKHLNKLLLALLVFPALAHAVPPPYTQNQETDRLISLGMTSELAAEITEWAGGGGGLLDLTLPNSVYLKGLNAAGTGTINLAEIDNSDNTRINSSASDELILQLEDDANRLISFTAASDTALKMKFGDGGTTAVQQLTISASTADADDDSTLILAGGGADGGTRGASITLPGEEVSGGADIVYNAGTGDTHVFAIAGTGELTISDDSLLLFGAAATIGTSGATSLALAVNSATQFTVGATGTLIGTGTSSIGWTVQAAANQACNTTCVTPCVTGIDTLGTGGFLACTTATADFCLCAGAS